jgi:hypothetical protein
MARIAPERSNFFVRSNYRIGVDSKPEQSVAEEQSLAARALFDLVEQAIRGIEQGAQVEAALRQLWASLVEFRYLRADDPGIRMAAQDLYQAAALITVHKRAGATAAVDIRLWRLLKQAEGRLRARLA